MSRSYRIKVRESLDRTIRAEDSVSTHLEILEILPPEQMAGLLATELEAEGYARQGDVLVRKQDGIVITVDANSGEVNIRADACADVSLESEKEGRAYDDAGPSGRAVRAHLQRELQGDLERSAREKQAELQVGVTDHLEGQLIDLSRELDGAVNRATAAALKIKAAQLGQIKEISEDKEAGSLTIVVEI
jgi:FtsH ternary system-associated peptide